jgi:transcriptional regulator with XRE-family HTH domain
MLSVMDASALLTDALKRELRAQKLSYAALAQQLGLSTATVKRMFARRNFDLLRLDAICMVLGLDFSALVRGLVREDRLVAQLDWAQEAEIVGDDQLFAVAVCALHLLSFEDMVAMYRIETADCVRCLLRLDRMGFLRLLPNNRFRLLVTRTFQWIPDGPILRYFRSQALDYLGCAFDGPGEMARVVNVRISDEARRQLLGRVESLVREYSAQHNADASASPGKRYPMSLLVAVRRWEPEFMRRLRRMPAQAAISGERAAGPAGSRSTP